MDQCHRALTGESIGIAWHPAGPKHRTKLAVVEPVLTSALSTLSENKE